MHTKGLSVFLLLFLLPPVTTGWAGEINRCVRANGEVTFTDRPCQPGERAQSMPVSTTQSSVVTATRETATGPWEIPLVATSRPGKYWVNVTLNGTVTGLFLIDTGASDLLLSEELFAQIQQKGLVAQDYMAAGKHILADGSMMETPSIHLDRVSLGDRGIDHVLASVGRRGVAPLLGANLLERFGKWHIDAEKKRLVLEGEEAGTPTDRDALASAECRQQKERADKNIQQIGSLNGQYERERQQIQELQKAIQAEPLDVVRANLVHRYDADLLAYNKNAVVHKANHAQLARDLTQQVEIYNRQCPGRMYRNAEGGWQRFPLFTTIDSFRLLGTLQNARPQPH